MTKRYFTSPFSIRSYASLILQIEITSTSATISFLMQMISKKREPGGPPEPGVQSGLIASKLPYNLCLNSSTTVIYSSPEPGSRWLYWKIFNCAIWRRIVFPHPRSIFQVSLAQSPQAAWSYLPKSPIVGLHPSRASHRMPSGLLMPHTLIYYMEPLYGTHEAISE